MKRSSILVLVACFALVLLALPAVGYAQFGASAPSPDSVKVVLTPPIPQAGRNSEAGSVWGMVFGILFALMVVGVALLPAKRGHQD